MKSLAAILTVLLFMGQAEAYSIRFLAWDHDVAARKVSVRNGGKDRAIADLHPDKRSGVIAGIAPDSELLLVTPETMGPDGQPATLRLNIPAGVEDPLVILLPDSGNASGLRAFTVEDSSGSFKYGSTRFFNTTGKPLMVRYDKSLLHLNKPWEPVDASPGGGARNTAIQVAAAGTPPAILYSTIWEYDPGSRKLALIVAGAESDPGPLAVKIISERNLGVAAR